MNFKIYNDSLSLVVNTLGAEVRSMKDASGLDLIWPGDETYWSGSSPLLFPCIGSNWKHRILLDGKAYPLKKHGLVKDMEFQVLAHSQETLLLQVTETKESLEGFPFCFTLSVRYRLDGNALHVEWDVHNPNAEDMPFLIGGHPALALPYFSTEDTLHGVLYFPEVDALQQTPTLPDGYAHHDRTETMVLDGHCLPLGNDTFSCDTILECTGRVSQVVLMDKRRRPHIKVSFGSPVVAFWAPCNGCAPFVCVEPWWGCCEEEGGEGDFNGRRFMNHVCAGGHWTASYTLELL